MPWVRLNELRGLFQPHCFSHFVKIAWYLLPRGAAGVFSSVEHLKRPVQSITNKHYALQNFAVSTRRRPSSSIRKLEASSCLMLKTEKANAFANVRRFSGNAALE